jgi:hypothetical protein
MNAPETGEVTVKIERSVDIRKLGEEDYEVIVHALVGTVRLREMARIGITSAERAEQVASEFRQQLGIEDS